jgi:glutamyl-tRNA synthetase
MSNIRVRFAPSPTGPLHFGTARTALFNFIFAASTKGKMILRIEDTDLERNQAGSLEDIKDNLTWLGITWDEEYKQSDRKALYKEQADKLLKEGKAYESEGAIFLKVDASRAVTFYDEIRGEVTFPPDSQKDFVIIRSNGEPIYHFTVVVDDADMKITHVIRGEDHLSNTPKHVLLFEALGASVPVFAHLPLILSATGKGKMSKRDGDTAMSDYRAKGYLPEALVNFTALLGWSLGDETIFSISDVIAKFKLADVKKAGAAFDPKKLNFINHHYLGELSPERYLDLAQDFIQDWPEDMEFRKKLVEILKDRVEYLAELPSLATPLLTLPKYPASLLVFKKSDPAKTLLGLKLCIETVKNLDPSEFVVETIRQKVEGGIIEAELSPGDVFWPMRVALSGLEASPSPQDLAELWGKDETLKRLTTALQSLERKK